MPIFSASAGRIIERAGGGAGPKWDKQVAFRPVLRPALLTVTEAKFRGRECKKPMFYGQKCRVPFVQHARENTPQTLWEGLFFIA